MLVLPQALSAAAAAAAAAAAPLLACLVVEPRIQECRMRGPAGACARQMATAAAAVAAALAAAVAAELREFRGGTGVVGAPPQRAGRLGVGEGALGLQLQHVLPPLLPVDREIVVVLRVQVLQLLARIGPLLRLPLGCLGAAGAARRLVEFQGAVGVPPGGTARAAVRPVGRGRAAAGHV
jgi:hypothetical protein